MKTLFIPIGKIYLKEQTKSKFKVNQKEKTKNLLEIEKSQREKHLQFKHV